MIHSLKYQGSTTLICKVTGMRKSEFVAKTQFFKGKLLRKRKKRKGHLK